MRVLIAFLLVSVLAVSAAKPDSDIKKGVEYIYNKIPRLRNGHIRSGKQWTEDLSEVITTLASHPKYSKWIEESEKEWTSHASRSFEETPFSFNCKISSSSTVPTSAHKLAPADVKVIAAIGDSLTAANGALANTPIGLTNQYRGYAWSMGGEVSLSQHTSLPNILKLYNSKLYGYSTGTGKVDSSISFLNYAEPGNKAFDMPRQARNLIDRMKSDPRVDFQRDWKVITVFIGGNDVCDYCKDKTKYSGANYITHIRTALDLFHKEVPRAFVNVLEVLDVGLVKETQSDSGICSALLQSLLCRCVARPDSPADEAATKAIILDYQKRVRDLVATGRYDTRDDFTVVNQPFYRNSAPPRLANGKFDMSYLAPDCFHFSAKGHGHAGRSLWNNMLQQEGRKSTQWSTDGSYLCPTTTRPYFATRKN